MSILYKLSTSSNSLADPRERQGHALHLGSFLFIFMQFLGKLADIIGCCQLLWLAPFLWEILDPPLLFEKSSIDLA